jgi:hypothetical protein
MNIKKIIREVINNKSYTDVCDMVSPRGHGKGGYMSNEEALNLINKIKLGKEKHIKNPIKLKQFEQVIQNFESDIKRLDANLDTIDTYLHKLRTILGC